MLRWSEPKGNGLNAYRMPRGKRVLKRVLPTREFPEELVRRDRELRRLLGLRASKRMQVARVWFPCWRCGVAMALCRCPLATVLL